MDQRSEASGAETTEWEQVSGLCHAMFAHDVGSAIDLDHAESLAAHASGIEGEARPTLRRARREPRSFEFTPAPLRVLLPGPPLNIHGHTTRGEVEAVIFDFGALSLTYRIPFDGPLDQLLALSEGLCENDDLLADTRRRVNALVSVLAPAITKPVILDMVEDYFVFEVRPADAHKPLSSLFPQQGRNLARILRAESRELSDQEESDALAARVSYGREDATLVDWNAAIVVDQAAEDTLAILEFVNVELLEMRLLDDRLDHALDEAYQAMADPPPGLRRRLGFAQGSRGLRRIAQLQVDSAALFEGVNNALKVVGDQFLARLYRAASQRMRLPEWDASILRKLGALESLYTKASDRQTTRRMEVLEWIIILLIAFEVAMGLWDRFGV